MSETMCEHNTFPCFSSGICKVKPKGFNVVSVFDGISCARVALQKAGFQIELYLASEIDKYALQVSEKNRINIKDFQLGDIKNLVISQHFGRGRPTSTFIADGQGITLKSVGRNLQNIFKYANIGL